MAGFSFLGTENFFLVLLPVLCRCIEAKVGLREGIILLLSTSVNDSLKMAFHGPRPYWYSKDILAYVRETSFGVPSDHAQIATGIWGMLAASQRKWWAWLIAILVILMIGISRMYLGVHFPHDVILGWLIGAFVLWLVLRFYQQVTQWLKKMSLGQQILVAFLASLVMILLSLIPFAWLKITAWQPPQAWVVYARGAISMGTAFTTAGTFFGLLRAAWPGSTGRVVLILAGCSGNGSYASYWELLGYCCSTWV